MKRSGFAQKARKPTRRTKWWKKPKQGKSALISQADGLIQELALTSCGGICQKCGKIGTEGHHIVKRRYRAVRWKLVNVIPLCHDCHELDRHPTRKAELERFCDEWLQREYAMTLDDLRFYAEHHEAEDPADAIERMKKMLDKE